MRSTLLLSLACAAFVGCGDHGLPGDMSMLADMSAITGADMNTDMGIADDIRVDVSFTKFAQDFAQTLCAHQLACGQLDAAQMAGCIERNTRHTGWDQDVEITKGRLEINEAQCLDALKNSRCDLMDSGFWTTRCVQFLFTAHQAVGMSCVANEECISGFCQHAGSDAGMAEQVTGCPGTCATARPVGAPCRINGDCASGAYCDRFTTHMCQALAPLNQPCSNVLGVGSGPPCQVGLVCPTFSGGTMPVCVLPAMQTALHGDCDPFQGAVAPTPECDAGMYCRFKYTAGAACAGPANCTAFGSYCDTTVGNCMNPSGGSCEMKLAANAVCDTHNDSFLASVDSQCADGTSCYTLGAETMPHCHALGSANGACIKTGGLTDTCKVGLYCNASGTCVPWFSDGATCDVGGHCPSGEAPSVNTCIADNADAGTATTCQVEKNVGATCAPGFEDALCANADLPGTSHCVPAGSSGVCAPKCF